MLLLRLHLVSLLVLFALPALAQTRHALVIGIDDYANVAPLQKAVNDARAVAAALDDAGVQVDLVVDPDEVALLTRVTAFTERLRADDEAMVFFAGHGVEVEGRNYLLPADIPAVEPGQEFIMMRRSLPLDDLLDMLTQRQVRMSLVMLDACRNNPFPRRGTRSLGGTRGLGRIDPPEGTFILFSAGAGQEALDRLSDTDPEPNSVFTRALVPLLTTPGLGLRDVVQQVRRDVRQSALSIGHQQFPAVYDQLDGDFTLIPAAAAPVQSDPCEAARTDWAMIGDTAGEDVITSFVATHPTCPLLVAIAQDRLAALAPAALPEPEVIEDPCADARLVWRLTSASDDTGVLERVAQRFATSCPEISQQAAQRAQTLSEAAAAVTVVPPPAEAGQECTAAAFALAPMLNYSNVVRSLERYLADYPNCGLQSEFARTELARRRVGQKIAPGTEATETAMALTREQRQQIQEMLNDLGLQAGTPDGAFGPRSRAAIRGFNEHLLRIESDHLSPANLVRLQQIHTVAPEGLDGRWRMTLMRRGDQAMLRRFNPNHTERDADYMLETFLLSITGNDVVVSRIPTGRTILPATIHSARVDADERLQISFTGHFLDGHRPESRRLNAALPLGNRSVPHVPSRHAIGQYDEVFAAIVVLTRQSYE